MNNLENQQEINDLENGNEEDINNMNQEYIDNYGNEVGLNEIKELQLSNEDMNENDEEYLGEVDNQIGENPENMEENPENINNNYGNEGNINDIQELEMPNEEINENEEYLVEENNQVGELPKNINVNLNLINRMQKNIPSEEAMRNEYINNELQNMTKSDYEEQI